MQKLALVFTFGLFLISPFTWASTTFEIPAVKLDSVKTEAQSRKIFREIDSWLGSLKKPAALELASNCESFEPVRKEFGLVYDPMTHLIQYQGLAKYPENHHSTFLAHEYGHVIFRANIELVGSRINDDLAGSLEYRKLLRQELRQILPNQCQRLPGDAASAFRKKMLKNDYFTFHALMLGAYDELFADIIAVLYSGSGDAVYQAVGGSQVNWTSKYGIKLPEGYRGRDFTYDLTVEQWHDNTRVIVFYDFLGSQSDLYNVLDPARSHLWKNYLRDLPKEKIPVFIAAYLEAVGIEFNRFIDETIWEQPVREMNERFIKSLDQKMRERSP